MGQDKYVYKCTPIEGQPPIYVGLYIDDSIYYSLSDAMEEWFENNLKSHLKVHFMGDASWFIGQRCKWHNDEQGKVSCHISQQAMIEGMLEKHNYPDIAGSQSLYRLGLKINRIKHDKKDTSTKEKLVRTFQSIMGGIN